MMLLTAAAAMVGAYTQAKASKQAPLDFWGMPVKVVAKVGKQASKCTSCGSHEWRLHAGKEKCSYCRSERSTVD
jgi:hypothetical protein